MMSSCKGFLLVTMEPPPALEEEFNDWYDTEHVPERLAVPGFETATRYVCTNGWPRYLAFYDLAHESVIDSPGYRAIANEHFSPWTQRILARAHGFYRTYGEQIYPGNRLCGRSARMLLIRFRGVAATAVDGLVDGARRAFEARDGVSGLRVFRSTSPAEDAHVIVETSVPLERNVAALATFSPPTGEIVAVGEYVVHAPRVAASSLFGR
jgi:hypothetical protein